MKLNAKKKMLSTLAVLAILFTLPVKAQTNIGNLDPPTQFSILELNASNKGLRLPQLTTTQRTSISDEWKVKPEADKLEGLVVYNYNTHCIEFWNGSDWISVCSSIIERSSKPTVNSNRFCVNNSPFRGTYIPGSKITIIFADGYTLSSDSSDKFSFSGNEWIFSPDNGGAVPGLQIGDEIKVIQTESGKTPSEPTIVIAVDSTFI